MIYDRHLDKTEDELKKLREVFDNKEVDRFLDGLDSGRINTNEKIIEFTNYIRTSDGLVQLEYARLQRLRDEGFVEKFATNYNNQYNVCRMLMDKMRSGISRGVKILEKFSEKARSRKKGKSRKVIENSKMGNSPYQASIFALNFYIESVKVLYNEILAYNEHLTRCIDLCLNIIEQVAYIKSHPESAYETHKKSRQDVLINNRSVIKRFIDLNADMENDLMTKVEEWKMEKKSMEEISAYLYHELDENEYNDWVISEEVMAARRQGITNQERAIWGDNKEQVMRCRTAYSHIDELRPEGQRDHIGGKFLALLYKWSNTLPHRGMEYWHTYFVDFYKGSGGVLTPVKKGAVKRGLAQIAKDEITPKEVEDFNKMMDNLVKKYMISGSKQENQMKEAVNF